MNKTSLNDYIESLQNIQRKLTALDSLCKSRSVVTYDTDADSNFIRYALTIRYPDGSTDGLNTFTYDFLDDSELYKFVSALVFGAQIHYGMEV